MKNKYLEGHLMFYCRSAPKGEKEELFKQAQQEPPRGNLKKENIRKTEDRKW